jgi:hypothetical protein
MKNTTYKIDRTQPRSSKMTSNLALYNPLMVLLLDTVRAVGNAAYVVEHDMHGLTAAEVR